MKYIYTYVAHKFLTLIFSAWLFFKFHHLFKINVFTVLHLQRKYYSNVRCGELAMKFSLNHVQSYD